MENLTLSFRDPMGTRTDAELLEVLRRAWLLPSSSTSSSADAGKFNLDSVVSDEGNAFHELCNHDNFDSFVGRFELQRR